MLRRTVRGISAAGLVAGALAGAVAGAGPATAGVQPGVWWNGAYEGYCLDADSSGKAFLGTCDSGDGGQGWNSPAVDGEPGGVGTAYALENTGTGQCLTGDAAGRVFTADCTYDGTQSWITSSLLVNRATGQCVAAESPGRLKQVPCDPDWLSDNQRWYPAQTGP